MFLYHQFSRFAFLLSLVVAFFQPSIVGANDSPRGGIEFNRDVRPILSENCFTCHGPDSATRLSPLRLDTKAGAFANLGGRFAIVPGDPGKSEIIKRISTENVALRMPPPYSGNRRLTKTEIETISRWIDQGATWQKHWSFITPNRPIIPAVKNHNWPRNGIDNFVLSRLEMDRLHPSEEADRATLIRRVTLDLTGIPPTPFEIDAFLNDDTPNAYEKVVDRLLQSPRYGEQMASEWLEAARYADTSGYQSDSERHMWRWRDWVITAFNSNMPFDRFTIEQLAGDMLPTPTLEQLIATGFNRNHRQNGEGGIIPEEYLVENVVDRVETTSTVWLGLTVGCARCHDHKYDPITQKEFYELFAHFNNIPERGKAFKYGNSPPFIKAPTPKEKAQLAELDRKISSARQQLIGLEAALNLAQKAWEKSLFNSGTVNWMFREHLLVHHQFDGNIAATPTTNSTSSTLEDGLPHFVPGPVGQAINFDGHRFVNAGDVANFSYTDRFTFAAWIYPTALDGVILSRAAEGEEGETGYGLYLTRGKLQANLAQRWVDDGVRIETKNALSLNQWHHILVTYDGTRTPESFQIYVGGKPQNLDTLLDGINNPIEQNQPLRIGASGFPRPRFHGHMADVRIYARVLTPSQAAVVSTRESISEIAKLSPKNRTSAQSEKIRLCFLTQYSPEHIRQAWKEVTSLVQEREQLLDSFSTVMVMREIKPRRETFQLNRGAYDSPGEKVLPGVPRILPPLPDSGEKDRLSFAKWLVNPTHPLTARVTVNRYWQMYFGIGLVKTTENFGLQGEWPSHPSLLDWLAFKFIDTSWNVKSMQKLIVMSSTYRQSSNVNPLVIRKDPNNRLLARASRFRLPAQVIRDQALSISGLLSEKLGGPSVKPYQPPGLWEELTGKSYQRGEGDELYRRSLYTFWKRTAPPPAMATFDSPMRDTCNVRQTRTNTPLQALNMMNDLAYVEASRLFAERMIREGGVTPVERLAFGYRLATAQKLDDEKLEILVDNFRYHLSRFQSQRSAALDLVRQGEHPRNQTLDVAELAAYTSVGSLILNLNQTITRQ